MKTITAYFTNHEPVNFTAEIFNLLKTDENIECITDAETGEIIFEKEEPEMLNMNEIEKKIENRPARSAWNKGVKEYALELIEELKDGIESGWIDPDDLCNPTLIEKALLNGASDWSQYSWGGCSMIYNKEIAERLCCPSELKRTNGGKWRPNSREEWLDTQARALFQAAEIVKNAILH